MTAEGVLDECLPGDPPTPDIEPEAEPVCAICLEESDMLPQVRLDCQHTFHKACLEAQVAAPRSGPRLTFGHLRCALCRIQLRRNAVAGLAEHFEEQELAHTVCVKRAREDAAIVDLDSMESSAAFEAIMDQMAAYRCARCEAVYCAGKAECGAQAELDPTTLLCSECAWREAKSDHKCRVHGPTKAIFKCDSCCSPATFDCSGNHYCDTCHGAVTDGHTVRPDCCGRVTDRCPLSMPHPPNQPRNHNVAKSGFVIGCTACLGIDGLCDMAAVSSETSQRF